MKFEIVRNDCRKFPKNEIILPTRKTQYSAGYDFYSNENLWINPNYKTPHVFWTDVKANLEPNLYLQISLRSSLATEGISLANGIGVIDHDYYNNSENDGNIGIMIMNNSNNNVKIQKGDRIAQGVILGYHTIEEDRTIKKRLGGLGSTGK